MLIDEQTSCRAAGLPDEIVVGRRRVRDTEKTEEGALLPLSWVRIYLKSNNKGIYFQFPISMPGGEEDGGEGRTIIKVYNTMWMN